MRMEGMRAVASPDPPCRQGPMLDSFEAYGCQVNAVEPAELFARYGEAGFLYPAKMERLGPFMPLVTDNWRRAMEAGESLLWFATWEDRQVGAWGSVSSWRSTHTAWNTQHAVSIGSPLASRAVLLSAAAVRSQRFKDEDRSQQNWFRPTNRFANKVFGSIVPNLGVGRAALDSYGYVAVAPGVVAPHDDDLLVVPCLDNRGGGQDDLFHLAAGTRGLVYAKSEELDHEDLNLDALDGAYQKVGLRRYRRIWIAYSKSRREAVGAVIAYRGPLGFNFSFLENRCDLLIHPMLSQQAELSVALNLIAVAAPEYADFQPGAIPVISEERTASLLVEAGGEWIRQYAQAVFLSSAYEDWYHHVERFYDRIIRAGRRRGFGASHLKAVPRALEAA